MLSNLIWGSPVKAVEEESESGEDIDTDDDGDDEGLGPLTQDLAKGAAVQVISDDDEQQEERQPESAASTASSAPRRFTAAEKGKGSPKRTDSYSTTKVCRVS